MLAELQRHTGVTQPGLVGDLRPQVGQGHRGAATDQQLRRRHAAPGRPDDDDALAAHGEAIARGHRSFKVVRLNSAKTMAVIRKRVMTFGSLQPVSSK